MKKFLSLVLMLGVSLLFAGCDNTKTKTDKKVEDTKTEDGKTIKKTTETTEKKTDNR